MQKQIPGSGICMRSVAFDWFESYPNRKQKREAKATLFYLVHHGNPNPNRSYHQTRAQRKRVAAEKEEQRRECALTFEKSRSKRYKACSDVVPAPVCGARNFLFAFRSQNFDRCTRFCPNSSATGSAGQRVRTLTSGSHLLSIPKKEASLLAMSLS